MAAWKLWFLIGLGLGIVELLVPAKFLLVALGVCAVLVGIVTWSMDLGTTAQFVWFAVLAAALIPLFIYLWRRRAPVRYPGTAGEVASAPQWGEVISTDPLTIKLRGDRYPARLLHGTAPAPGDEIRVEGFDGITALISKH